MRAYFLASESATSCALAEFPATAVTVGGILFRKQRFSTVFVDYVRIADVVLVE